MSGREGLVTVGRVGRAHGSDGSFYVVDASHPLPEGASVTVGGLSGRIERRAGTAERPLVRVSGLDGRDRIAALRGEHVLMPRGEAPLGPGEWLAEDLVGCDVPGLGRVRRVVRAPSCDVLEVGPDGVLVPLVSDAVKLVDPSGRRIEVDRGFLGLDEPGA